MPSRSGDLLENRDRELYELEKIRKNCKSDKFLVGIKSYRKGYSCKNHAHGNEAQIIFVLAGILRVKVRSGILIIPQGQGLWIPPQMAHAVECPRDSRTLYLYFSKKAYPHIRSGHENDCFGFTITPLLRELVLKFCSEFGKQKSKVLSMLFPVIIHEIQEGPQLPIEFPQGRDVRLIRLLEAIQKDNEFSLSLEDHIRACAITSRTALRLAKKDLQCSLTDWRNRYRLLVAIENLSLGQSVLETAVSVGFDNPSGLVKLFKKYAGQSPKNYLKRF